MTRRYLGTIRAEDVGKFRYMALPGTLGRLLQAMGHIQASDVGKQYFDVDGVLQVENDEQRDKRLAGGTIDAETARESRPQVFTTVTRKPIFGGPDLAGAIEQIARDGARVHQLRFARERLESLRDKLTMADALDFSHGILADWLADVDYAIAQIKAAEGQTNER